MWPIFRKEISGFFCTLTGYFAGIVFLTLVGLLMWVLPTEWNILNSGEATLATLFEVAPWLFLFLVPAVTMRSFAEERHSGTLDLLLAKPVSEWQLLLAKYFASLVLIVALLTPTLVYFLSIVALNDPAAPIDTGATWASYLGLFFLAATYAAIGILASTLSQNSIVAFLTAALGALILYIGFDIMARLPLLKGVEFFTINLGIAEHYRSIQRGVIDLRDLLYFLAIITLALSTARLRIAKFRS